MGTELKQLDATFMELQQKEIQNYVLKYKDVLKSRKLLLKLDKQLEDEINAAQGGNPSRVESLIRSLKNLRESTEELEKTIPDFESRYKYVMEQVKLIYTEELQRKKYSVEEKLLLRGELNKLGN